MKRHPSADLMRKPTTLFYHFDQVAREIIDFARTLKRQTKCEDPADARFYDHYIEPNAQVSLLGYSMGGLQALYTFLLEPRLFGECVLINSGVAISRLNPKPIEISLRRWKKMAQEARDEFKKARREFVSRSLLHDVLFGFTKHEEAFNRAASRLLFISGGADPVANPRYLSRLVSDEGLNLVQIAGLEHPLESPVFDRWFFIIVDSIHHFLTAPAADNLSAEAIVASLRRFTIRDQRWDHWLLQGDEPQQSAYVDDRDQNLLLHEFVDDIQPSIEQFQKLYVMSKRYFTSDAELLRSMERLGRKRPRP